MRHVLVTLTFLLAATGWGVAAPANAANEDLASVRTRLSDSAQQLTATNREIDRLESAIAARQLRVERERGQVRVLARVLYEQPESPVLMVAQSSSIDEAMTRAADLLVAAGRARAAESLLKEDLGRLQADRTRLAADRARLERQRKEIEAQYAALVAQQARTLAAALAPAAPAPPPHGSMQEIIMEAWSPLGSGTASWAVRLAQCESGLNPYAVNRSSGAAGLFQFLPSTWAGTPYRGQSPFDPVANSQAAVWLYQHYGPGQWECSRRI